jgi:hypothetical protein
VHESLDKEKENNSMVSNGGSVESKNKSYVNAMLALQKKVKTLEDENSFIKKSLSIVNDERNRSMSESCATEEELKSRIQVL